MAGPSPESDTSGWPLARAARWMAPLVVAALALGGWEWSVRHWEVPHFILPAPSRIVATLIERRDELGPAWAVTLRTTLSAFAAAAIGGALLAAVFTSSRWIEASLFPYAIVLQVTPLVAVAPLVMLWIGMERLPLIHLVCALIVAFFPVLSNTAVGLRSADRGLRELFQLYGANPWQRLRLLLAPTALPYCLAGLRIAGNLSLVGAVVAEFVTGAVGDESGLASLILTSQLRTDTPLMFAALTLVSLTGIAIFFALSGLSYLLLRRWHESAIQ